MEVATGLSRRRSPDPPADSEEESSESQSGEEDGIVPPPRVPRRSIEGETAMMDRARRQRVALGIERPAVRHTLASAVEQLPRLRVGHATGANEDEHANDRTAGSAKDADSSPEGKSSTGETPLSPTPRIPNSTRPPYLTLSPTPNIPRRTLPPNLNLNVSNRSALSSVKHKRRQAEPQSTKVAGPASSSSSSSKEWQEITGNRPTIEEEVKRSIAAATSVGWETKRQSSGNLHGASRRDSLLDASGAIKATALPNSHAQNEDLPKVKRTDVGTRPYRPQQKDLSRGDSFASMRSDLSSSSYAGDGARSKVSGNSSGMDKLGVLENISEVGIDELQSLTNNLFKDISALIMRPNKNVKTLPGLLEAVQSLKADLNSHADRLRSAAMASSSVVTSSMQALLHTLHDACTLVSRISNSRRFNVDLPGFHSMNRKFRNKVSRAILSINDKRHGLVTSIFIVERQEDSLSSAAAQMSTRSPSTGASSAVSRWKKIGLMSVKAESSTSSSSSSSSKSFVGARNARQGAEERCMLGDRYFSGLGVEKSHPLAFRNYKLSAEAGLVRAMNAVGCMLAKGQGVAASVEAAGEWYERAAESGDADGLYNLAMLLDDRVASARQKLEAGIVNTEDSRTGVVRTMREVERLLLEAGRQRHPAAMNALGTLYEHADPVGTSGVVCDPAKALKWYKRAAERGHAVAQNNMGSFCFIGKPPMSGPDYVQAREWFEMAAAQGDPVAQNNLGIMYENGRGSITQDLVKASQLYARSAAQGNPSAMSNWGYMLVRRAEASAAGRTSQVFHRAALLFRAAIHADGGWPEADGSLDDTKNTGLDDAGIAFSDFSHVLCGAGSASSSVYNTHSSHMGGAAGRASAEGSDSIGGRHFSRNTRLNIGKELRTTNADACFNLAQMYESGYGVERDLQAAFSYYKRAADNPARPHARAACRTASMLYSGSAKGSDEMMRVQRGGEESSVAKTRRLADAMHYYKKAAELSDGGA